MAKPIITLNGLKMVIMLGMLVIILTGIRFAADIIVPFILALFLAVIINPLVQLLVRCRVPRVLAISLLIGLIVMLAIVLLASLGPRSTSWRAPCRSIATISMSRCKPSRPGCSVWDSPFRWSSSISTSTLTP